MYIDIYIYIHTKRERERERWEGEIKKDLATHTASDVNRVDVALMFKMLAFTVSPFHRKG